MPKLRIIGTVVFVLIAGILGSTDSQSSENTLQSACIKNGGPNAWENLRVAKANYNNCVASVKAVVKQGFQDSVIGVDNVLTKYCNKLQILRNCIRTMMESVNSCLEPDQRVLARRNMDTTLLAVGFPCSNRLLLTVAFATTNKQCLGSKVDSVTSCIEELLFGSNSSELVFSFNNQTCSSVQKYVQCSLSLVAECESVVLSTVLNVMSSVLTSGLRCNNLPPASQGGFVTNILSPVTNRLLPRIF